jgi:serine/threonine protein kinase/tetratricopeptide (TPR) repeat protein
MEDSSELVGRVMGKYRLLEKLGSGGMGAVYRAEDTQLNRQVALKVLLDDSLFDRTSLERFRREARSASSLNHPYICTVYDAGEDNGNPYLVMELLEGRTLADVIASRPLKTATILHLAIQVCEALQYAHEKGIVHRDLKPPNIFVTSRGDAKLLDFGLAKKMPSNLASDVTASAMTKFGQVLGTMPYMSPEQVEGHDTDGRSDLFSLGAVFYEMATGTRAFQDKNSATLLAEILRGEPIPVRVLNPDVPAELQRIIGKLLEKDPADRYQSAKELSVDLRRLTKELTPSVLGTTRARRYRAAATGVGKWKVIVPAAAALLALSVGAYFYLHRSPKLTDKDTIVLADFTNSTGDPVFDDTLRQGLAVQLEQSPFLSLISDERIQKTLALMAQPADARLTPALGRDLCERTGSAAVLDGTIASLGTQYVLGLRATNCRTGDVLDAEQVQAARKEDVLNALSRIASRFRSRIGESLATLKEHDTPLVEATTPSLDAFKAFSAGWKLGTTVGSAAALPLYKRATEIDPQFATAYGLLGRSYGDIGESALAAQNTAKAYELRDRASDPEKFFIVASHDTVVTGNLERARQTCEAWAQTYPRDPSAHAFLAGMIYPVLGEYDKVLEEALKSIEANPDAGFTYTNLAYGYLALDRTKEAGNTLQRAAARKIEIPDFVITRYQIAFVQGDRQAMEREAALALKTSGAEDMMAAEQAFTRAYSGHLQQAKTLSQHAVELAQQSGQSERAAELQAGPAVREAFFGNADAARRDAAAVLKLSRARDVQYGAAFALALAGDAAQAQTLADDLEKRFPEDTAVRINYVPALRALIALHRNDSAKAIELLQTNVPYELGEPPSSYPGFYGLLYPIYVRGQAYLAQHRGTQAATEFQKILDHPGIALNDPVGALARLQLGRAHAMAGDTAKARVAYQNFLTLWKDADPEIPVLKQAKAEYAKLQ